VTAALGKTGGVLTSCGLIMAGTFGTLLVGTLSELRQMGFALAFGVLLDALVVRPVLVPAFLLLLARWREPAAPKTPSQATAA
jgi:RND superfamily putative drug exporter